MTPGEIIAALCAARGVTVKQVKSSNRHAQVTLARHECFGLLRCYAKMSNSEIGNALGARDASTVTHGIQRVQRFADAHPAFALEMDRIVGVTILEESVSLVDDLRALHKEFLELRRKALELAVRIRGSAREAA